jgi:pimeloyl-ACP methyl ester carboxylesterase
MPVVKTNQVDFHVQLLGQGPPVAMLHGLVVGSLATWYFTSAPTLSKTHRVLLYDLRGHGKSERVPTGYDLSTMTADLDALLSRYEMTPVNLAGHSYGALVALRYTLDHPAKVKKLALVDLPLPPAVLADALLPEHYDQEHLLSVLPAPVKDSLKSSGRRARRLLESLQFLVKQSSLVSDLQAEPDINDTDLGRIACPVLCLYGKDSFFLPVSDRIKRAMPKARMELLPGDHYLPYQAPAEMTKHIQEFFHG